MNDLISKKQIMAHIESQYRQWGDDYDALQILGDIEDAPTIKAEFVKHGKWLHDMGGYWCSVCDEFHDYMTYYCPSCGAKLQRDEEEVKE